MTQKVLVLGGGTAGLLSGIALLQLAPGAEVTVVRSSALSHIMVGEGTFADTPRMLHGPLGVPRDEFLASTNPTVKLGIRFEWGPRPYFDYPFEEDFDNQILPGPDKPWGYYHLTDARDESPFPATTRRTRVGYHVENQRFVEYLEGFFEQLGGDLVEGKVIGAERSDAGLDCVLIEGGARMSADLYVDASGFRGELIHRTLGEPYVSMRDHLFCDRAVVGGWQRGDEPIQLYTTVETMDSGWAWQIEHEHLVNRGYVYCSAFADDEEASAEFLRKNPLVAPATLRVIRFETRRIRRSWVGNVVAVGNSCGFIEPLEATNLQLICQQAMRLAETVATSGPSGAEAIDAYNEAVTEQWIDIQDFLAMHYRFNTRLNTPFWKMARNDTPLGNLEPYIEEYKRSGPVLMGQRNSMFGVDGHLAILLGMRVPWRETGVR
ncbi:Tryptophan halogenase [Frankia torreyi]|uniref:Tryptophan halogenase n=1 Tax=Frankia torreyi TaxID=1856 RepID=A0A0D8B9Y1_9ACTN|nr:tryptophan 7-halogenase [Frankia torreyi]KJE21088.1 Tryptophan halogenase [Frankia torreyi]